jgi:ribonuclease HI
VEYVDKSKPWAYFNETSSQGDPTQSCCAGGSIFMKESHSLKFRAGVGQGTNNYAKLMDLKLLLTLAGEKGITSLQIFEDSMLVIKWMRRGNSLSSYLLQPLFDELKGITCVFNFISFQRVYREKNQIVDGLSKAGLQMAFGQWFIQAEGRG